MRHQNKQQQHRRTRSSATRETSALGYLHPQFDSLHFYEGSEEFVDRSPVAAPPPAPPRKLARAVFADGRNTAPRSTDTDPMVALSLSPSLTVLSGGVGATVAAPPVRQPLQAVTNVQPTVMAAPTPVKRTLQDLRGDTATVPSSAAKRPRLSLGGPDDSMNGITFGAEQVLRMVDESLVDTPDKSITTPRVERSAPGPSPRLGGPSYAYDTHVRYPVLPPRPIWMSRGPSAMGF